jgi:hypothetical protein
MRLLDSAIYHTITLTYHICRMFIEKDNLLSKKSINVYVYWGKINIIDIIF